MEWKGAINSIAGVIHVVPASKQPPIKGLVLISSSTAAYIPIPNKERIVITTEIWNDAAIHAAWDEDIAAHNKRYIVYGASRTEAERGAFK
ncbi:NAD(P)-binding protein [Penicillium manginii]|uniref:NAD(P)-binding protein n=1 Tax=Penicillium manginii TaxID=203109 RepID=UPI0025486A20|nr:NAD(P)-binding protein [Penicillium manginii]KAJ5744215.1 NAD(P)-binding protein [Penicillium manginii]